MGRAGGRRQEAKEQEGAYGLRRLAGDEPDEPEEAEPDRADGHALGGGDRAVERREQQGPRHRREGDHCHGGEHDRRAHVGGAEPEDRPE